MADSRIEKFARTLVDYSTRVKPGDRVGIRTTTEAIPLVQSLYALILERGAFPHVLLEFPDQHEILLANANGEQLEYVSPLEKFIFEECDVLIKARAVANTRSLTQADTEKQALWQRSLSPLLRAQTTRGAVGELRWMSTIFPTQAYAMEADMGFQAFQDFFYNACHADDATPDPIAYWQGVKHRQNAIIERLQGHDRVTLRSPNADLSLSIKGRTFLNAAGEVNMPDGEVFTGPVENSVNGWVRYTYPAVYQGRVVEGVELKFEDGKVVEASASKNENFLLKMLDTDPGARYLGEFAIGTNYEIDRFTGNILFDEKIGGSFHMAVGASYPETGGQNRSMIHWDMICDMRKDSEITVDGEVIYKNGAFV